MADPGKAVANIRKLMGAAVAAAVPGLRKVDDALKWPLISRAGNLDQVSGKNELYAMLPAEVVASGYADPAEAMRVARQAGLQVLGAAPPRGEFPRDFPGLDLAEVPAFFYPGRAGIQDGSNLGLASVDPLTPAPGRQIEVALKGRTLDDAAETVRHEALHLLDPGVYRSTRAAPGRFLSNEAKDFIRGYAPFDWEDITKYWGNQDEINATLSRIRRLRSQEELVTTPQQAREMLDRVIQSTKGSGRYTQQDIRDGWTARAVLNSKQNMERLIPWMTGALSAGGVAAGINSQEEP
jgi:hypothetical protein